MGFWGFTVLVASSRRWLPRLVISRGLTRRQAERRIPESPCVQPLDAGIGRGVVRVVRARLAVKRRAGGEQHDVSPASREGLPATGAALERH